MRLLDNAAHSTAVELKTTAATGWAATAAACTLVVVASALILIRNAFIIVIAAALVIAAIGGYFLAMRSLSPVAQIDAFALFNEIRANHAFEKAQEVDTLEATFTPSWLSCLIPSANTWWTFTLNAEVFVDGAVITTTTLDTSTRWLLTDVDLGLNAEGIPEVKGTFVKEISGISKGLTVVYPAPAGNTLPTVPPVPSVPMFPIPLISLPPLPT